MNSMEVIRILAVLFSCSLLDTTWACPNRCFCFRSQVRCMFINLQAIPNAPADTNLLDLRFNNIKRIPRGSFPPLPHLNTLLLNNNELEELEEGSFDGLPELRYLYLYKNKIQRIHPDTFKSVPKLEQLLLHSNDLSRLPEHLFDSNTQLKRLRLDSNALVCDCNMMWLADMLKEKHSSTQAAVTCRFPNNLQGRSIMSISKEDFHCEKPKITQEPRDVEVKFGNTAHFTCRAEGDPVPEIMWLHNDHMIDTNEDERYKILQDGTLMIESTQDSVTGVYECMARNAAGMVKTGKVELRYSDDPEIPNLEETLTDVTVGARNNQKLPRQDREIPKFMETPNDVTAVEGEDVELPCEVSGTPRPDIAWTLNSESVVGHIRLRKLDSGSLQIINIRMSDAGVYECKASNSIQSISASARVRVLVRPVITRAPADVSVLQGSITNFTCEARGDTQPVLTWTKDGAPLRNNGRYELLRNGEILRIQNVVANDEGTFMCKAENAAGFVTADARLRIIENQIPSFVQTSDLVSAQAGTDITLRCVATGKPNPLYDWMRDGRVLQSRNRMTIQAGDLRISNVHQHDAGRYDCVAENVVGRASKSVFLQVQGGDLARPGDQFVSNAFPEAKRQVNAAVNTTRSHLFDRSRTHTAQDLLAAFRYPPPGSLDLARAEEIFEQTLEIIHRHVSEGHNYNLTDHETSYQELVSPALIHMIANMSGCLRRMHVADCYDACFHRQYRTIDGSCNNLQNSTWGAANTAFHRLLPPIYENGFNTPVGWNSHKLYRGTHLPSARLVSSLLVVNDHVTNDEVFTHMLMQWGQFIDHDMDLAPQAISFARFSDGRRCNETCEKSSPCFPIAVPSSDPRITTHSCLGFTRSSATCNSGSTSLFFNTVSPRQQLNVLTSYIDASMVYGSSDLLANHLRELSSDRGLLREGPTTSTNKRLLPFDDDDVLERMDCQLESSKRHIPCFIAGDPRVNEQLALTAMHTLWMRQHNHMANIINRLNPHWDGNKVYHEVRKIMGALFQHITYKHWLPKVLGPKGMEIIGPYEGYKSDVNPSIVNEFAVAGLRFGHTLIQPQLFRLNETFHEVPEGHLPLHRAFFTPYRLVEEGGIDSLIRGLFGAPAKKRMPGEFLNNELTEKLFQHANALGQDLASLNIQRSRDHGTQFYNDYREHCGLPRAKNFEDLQNEIQYKDTRDKLQALYGHPDNIDLFIGGISETIVEGAKVGPTLLCILAGQFKRLRDGDRFWYEKDGVFLQEQLVAIQQTSIASAICESSDIRRVQKDVFLRVQNDDEYLGCDEIAKLDLQQWTDCCEDCRSRATLATLAARFRGRRSTDYSYPEQRPLERFESNTTNSVFASSQDKDQSNETPDYEEEHETEKENEKDMTHLLMEDMKLVDNRIEGIEETMMEMNQLINRLKRKIRQLERRTTNRRTCLDQNDTLRKNGEKWIQDACTTCICKLGQIECKSEDCGEDHNK